MKKYYAVMKLANKIDVQGIASELPSGEFFIPVFEDEKRAKEHADDKYEVMEMKVPK